ncbi:MAG: hypothetical protein EZS28_005003 [Streblomastix strix]|uniref:HIT-type domain-containing protein n=1 Tax=Streblomastix strix TaxID=222440 RepID=A0A5J4WYQ3_9EUKA|nr:MAG: hypothetical protein EZS28_005003 [Streblomastix strix]
MFKNLEIKNIQTENNLEQETTEDSVNPPKRIQKICEVCNISVAKYKCPACNKRTCSVACVKGHKIKDGCSGLRRANDFIPLNKMDVNTIYSDVAFLQQQQQILINCQRPGGLKQTIKKVQKRKKQQFRRNNKGKRDENIKVQKNKEPPKSK